MTHPVYIRLQIIIGLYAERFDSYPLLDFRFQNGFEDG
jgi:hypothetical protein